MDWHVIVGILAGCIQIAAVVPYIKDIIWGTTRPNIVSWGLWTLIQSIGIAIQVTSPEGFSWSLIFLIATTFNTALVVLLCLRGYGSTQFGNIEKACLLFALIAVVCWLATEDPLLALGFDILADVVAVTPTLIKTWKEPYSETVLPWVMVSFAAILGALSSTVINAENLALPIYFAIVNGAIALTAFIGQRRTKRPVTI